MKNEIRLGSFSILHELGPLSIGFRSPDGEFVQQQIIDTPAVVSPAELPRLVKTRYGITAIEIMDGHLFGASAQELASLRRSMKAEGVSVPMVLLGRYVAEADAAYRAEDLAEVERLLERSAEFGAEAARIVLMPPPIVPRGPAPSLEVVVEVLQRLLDFSESVGIRLCVENDDEFTADAERVTALLDAVGPRLGFVLDTGNLEPLMSEIVGSFTAGREAEEVAGVEAVYETIAELLPRADIVHLKSYGFHSDGRSKVYDLDRVLGMIRSSGFEGPLTIEAALGDPSRRDAVIRQTLDRIDSGLAVAR